MFPKIKHILELKGLKLWNITDGSNQRYFIDFGQNISGYIKINFSKIALQKNQTVTLKHAEVLMHPP